MLDKLEVGKTYVFVDEEAKWEYLKTPANSRRFQTYYGTGDFEGYYLEETAKHSGVVEGWVGRNLVIYNHELKYFKLKEENKMLKPDDKVQVEMTALEALLIKNILGNTTGSMGYSIFKKFKYITGLPIDRSFDNSKEVMILDSSSEFVKWALSQFKSPHQEKIEQLEKEIHEKASELARLKMEG